MKALILLGEGCWGLPSGNFEALDKLVAEGWTGDVAFSGSIVKQVLGVCPEDKSIDDWKNRVGNMRITFVSLLQYDTSEIDPYLCSVAPEFAPASDLHEQVNAFWSTGTDLVVIHVNDSLELLNRVANSMFDHDADVYMGLVLTDSNPCPCSEEQPILPGVPRPPQSQGIACDHKGLMAVRAPQVARRDSVSSLNDLLHAGKGACGGVAGHHIVAEMAYILGKTHKYGA